jgi:hypothetical protein
MTKKDEAITQIRQVRHRISEEHGHDPQSLVNYYIELQKQYAHLKPLTDQPAEPIRTS